jgi:hypothetical protein
MKHASKFSLIHSPSTHMKTVNLDCPVHLDGQEVKAVTKYRILELTLDNNSDGTATWNLLKPRRGNLWGP